MMGMLYHFGLVHDYMGLGRLNSLKLNKNKRIELVDISELDEVSVIIFLVDLCR